MGQILPTTTVQTVSLTLTSDLLTYWFHFHLPASKGNFISTKVNILIGKHVFHLGKEFGHKVKGGVEAGVYWTKGSCGLALAVALGQQVCDCLTPRLRMACGDISLDFTINLYVFLCIFQFVSL